MTYRVESHNQDHCDHMDFDVACGCVECIHCEVVMIECHKKGTDCIIYRRAHMAEWIADPDRKY